MIPVMTLVLWVFCLIVGLLGLRISRERPRPLAKAPEPPPVQALNVEIAKEPAPPDVAAVPPDIPPPDAAPPQPAPAPVPALPQISAPSPAIAFAVPVNAPPIAPPPRAIVPQAVAPANAAPATAPALRRITFGQGEGRQPAPEYPREAIQAGQEGVVVVRFNVDADGMVTSASLASASRWPLLNQAALSVVKDRWRLGPGPPRSYEVSIRFQLNRL
jgi:protein TonB